MPPAQRQGHSTQPHGEPQWSPQPVEPYPYTGPHTGQPQPANAAPTGYGYQPPFQQPALGPGAHQQSGALPAPQHGQDEVYDDDVEYEEAPPRRRRWLIAAALVGSIGLGGGLAYAYKTLLAPKGGDRTQIVKAPREPAKVAPTDRGGKQFANTNNSTVMNRVPPEGSAAAAGGTTDSSGVRRVSTVPVDRNLAPMPPPPSPSASTGVPGMIVVGGNNPGMQPPMPAPTFEQPLPPPRAAAPSPMPPTQPTQPPPARVAAAPPPPPVARPAAPRAPPPEAPDASAGQPVKTAAPRPKTNGYVAVLGYQRSQLEAMKMMADLQQKYDALRDKKLEIVQSDQTSRGLGVIYRVVVGPRGGIGPARDVCQQLRQAGMAQTGCYPLASE